MVGTKHGRKHTGRTTNKWRRTIWRLRNPLEKSCVLNTTYYIELRNTPKQTCSKHQLQTQQWGLLKGLQETPKWTAKKETQEGNSRNIKKQHPKTNIQKTENPPKTSLLPPMAIENCSFEASGASESEAEEAPFGGGAWRGRGRRFLV